MRSPQWVIPAKNAITRSLRSRRIWLATFSIALVWSIASPIAIFVLVGFPAPLHDAQMRNSIPIEFAHADRQHFSRRDRIGLTYKRASWRFGSVDDIRAGAGAVIVADECSVGLPFRCLIGRCAFRSPSSSTAAQQEFDTVNAWASKYGATRLGDALASATGEFAPSTILWSRLGANFIVATSLTLIALVSIPGFRDFFRELRGHCLSCGFDLTGLPSDQCPECGSPRAGPG